MAPPTTSLNLGLRGGFIGAVKDMMSGNSDAGLDENGHYTLVLVRHGESQWNKENRFTGWVDVPLAESGMEEAHRAAKNLKEEGFTFDILYTSVLQRAIKTGLTILEDMGLLWIPIEKNWRLNERHYGALQGLNKKETVEKHGADQVNVWRRSYDVPPPAMDEDHEFYAGKEAKYANWDEGKDGPLPKTECLKDCVARFLPWFNSVCIPSMKAGKKVLIAAHGNSLRALVKHLDSLSDEQICGLNIPTAIPLVYKLDKNFKPVSVEGAYPPLSARYACDPAVVKAAIEGVAAQTGPKKA